MTNECRTEPTQEGRERQYAMAPSYTTPPVCRVSAVRTWGQTQRAPTKIAQNKRPEAPVPLDGGGQVVGYHKERAPIVRTNKARPSDRSADYAMAMAEELHKGEHTPRTPVRNMKALGQETGGGCEGQFHGRLACSALRRGRTIAGAVRAIAINTQGLAMLKATGRFERSAQPNDGHKSMTKSGAILHEKR